MLMNCGHTAFSKKDVAPQLFLSPKRDAKISIRIAAVTIPLSVFTAGNLMACRARSAEDTLLKNSFTIHGIFLSA
jgi:hypothetical protein